MPLRERPGRLTIRNPSLRETGLAEKLRGAKLGKTCPREILLGSVWSGQYSRRPSTPWNATTAVVDKG